MRQGMRRTVWIRSAALLAALSACSNQAEGDRCDLDLNSDDCDVGLICTSLQSLTGAGTGAICCPEDNATVAACRPGSLTYAVDPDYSDDTSTLGSLLPEVEALSDASINGPPVLNADAATPNTDAATPTDATTPNADAATPNTDTAQGAGAAPDAGD